MILSSYQAAVDSYSSYSSCSVKAGDLRQWTTLSFDRYERLFIVVSTDELIGVAELCLSGVSRRCTHTLEYVDAHSMIVSKGT